MSHFDVVGIFNKAHPRSADIQKAAKGFECTGIVPFNPDIFTDADFAAACVTNIQVKQPHRNEANFVVSFPLAGLRASVPICLQ